MLIMMHPIEKNELIHAQLTLFAAVLLQFAITQELHVFSKYLVAFLELLLILGIGLTAPRRHTVAEKANKTISILLIGTISAANAGALALLIKALVSGSQIPGKSLLSGAFAIFLTNVIMFGLWYWEVDSPGLSGHHKQEDEVHFQFPQMQSKEKRWRPTFFDYLYTSLTNSTAFSPTDTMPITHTAKALMGFQALIALLTVVLVTARAVNILG
jgi:uncharacterized membrane protein